LHLAPHAAEGGPAPGRGEAPAVRLAPLMPGAGHIVHMPAHIYWRVGRYADAVAVNVRAVEADKAYFAKREPSPFYRGLYYPHNIDFIWQSASMAGPIAQTPPSFALVPLGPWEEAPRQPAPPAELPYVTGAWRYARGLAFVATGRRADAAAELAVIQQLAGSVPADRTPAGLFKTKAILELAANVLAGEIAARSGQTDVAVRHLLAAVAEQ